MERTTENRPIGRFSDSVPTDAPEHCGGRAGGKSENQPWCHTVPASGDGPGIMELPGSSGGEEEEKAAPAALSTPRIYCGQTAGNELRKLPRWFLPDIATDFHRERRIFGEKGHTAFEVRSCEGREKTGKHLGNGRSQTAGDPVRTHGKSASEPGIRPMRKSPTDLCRRFLLWPLPLGARIFFPIDNRQRVGYTKYNT